MSDESSNVQMRCHVPGDGTLEVHLAGSYTMASDRLPRCPDADKGPWRKIVFRDEGLVQWDTSLLALVRRAERDAPGTEVDLSDLPSGLRALAELTHRGDGDADGDASRPSTPFLVGAGVGLAKRAREGAAFLDFLGRVMISMGRCACGRAKTRPGAWRDHLWATGPAALGIVTVISLLVGAILAFVGAVQLGMFGAELFVANLVGLGMVMEMGALMTGIILTGRTGAAFAAQLGTMVVNEEVDALRTMGIPPSDYLVLPRVAAVALTTPLLVLYANALGLLGGALVGAGAMDIPPRIFFEQAFSMMTPWHVTQGLIKGTSYGIWIGLAGCHRGLSAGRNASEVGRAATSAVVTGILGIVVIDAAWTFLFMLMDT